MTMSRDNFFIADIFGGGKPPDRKSSAEIYNSGSGKFWNGADNSLCQVFAATSLSGNVNEAGCKNGFHVYSRADAVAAVDKALQLRFSDRRSQTTAASDFLELTVLPGQELFFVPASVASNIIEIPIGANGRISQAELTSRQLRPYYNSFPLTSAKQILMERLCQLGYQLLNKADCPDSYTIVHLVAGREQIFASVTMAVDADLQPLKAQDDSRLSEANHMAVENILRAKTLCEVLPGPYSLKVAFHKFSLQVCIEM
jgi:hypothetical protein